jgi:hypothetical protein
MESLWQDVRYSFRTLVNNRGVTMVALRCE